MSHRSLDDLSAYIIAGRVKARRSEDSETAARTPALGIEDAVEAERIGFRRIFLSERWNLKEAGALLGGAGARTSRIGLATGILTAASRHPLHAAALGSTMQAAFGPRFVLGLGRGDESFLGPSGLHAFGFRALADYADIVRRLWRGETVSYEGPAGCYPRIALGDLHDGPAPEIWFGTFGLAKGAVIAAEAFDGVLLPPNLTPRATRASVDRIHQACARIGRDPASIRIAQCVITTPELSDTETRELAHGRAVTYLQVPGYGDTLVQMNGWDPTVRSRLVDHAQLRGNDVVADARFHRSELLEPAKLVPDEWMIDSCAIGSVAECVASLRRFREAGADEIVTYGSTPGQNTRLAAAWAGR
ncbi:MAG: TIGR03857 family LLM class F420-dependent oxidoreductase [Candidatus Binatia bacterium]